MAKATWRHARAHFEANLMLDTDDCKTWPYATNSAGYGSIGIDGKTLAVHVLACIAWNGPKPEGKEAAHGPCHNPLCWNGRHLSWKTRLENQHDKFRDGTDNKGVKHPRARLTEADVLEIRALAAAGVSQRDIALKFGIPHRSGQVSSIVHRRYWAHI